jgi:hypothetical protein
MDLESRHGFAHLLMFLVGSAVIAVSAGVGMTYAFRSNYLMVYICFVTLILGYKTAQMGYHNGWETHKAFLEDAGKLKNQKIDIVSFLGGSVFISLGFVLLGKAVVQLSILTGLGAGAVIGGGYILSHWAINNRLV